jgi:hypothetical protein
MTRRYHALRFLSLLFKVLSVLTFILSIVQFFQGTSISGVGITDSKLLLSLEALVGVAGIISSFLLWARAEIIMVYLDTEENTRATAMYLRELVTQAQPLNQRQRPKTWDEL